MFYGFDGHPISKVQWGLKMESPERIVAQDTIGDYFISTIWLGLDHGFPPDDDEPLIFETMVFRNSGSGRAGVEQARHSTWEQAEAHHARWKAQAEALEAAEILG